MTKKQWYVPRLILFGNKFEHDVLGMLGLMAENYDLTNGDFGEMEEANILFDYVSLVKGTYKKAMIVYCYKKEGLIFHHMFNEGPCFEIKCMEDVEKILSISKLINITSRLPDIASDFEVAGNEVCTLGDTLAKYKTDLKKYGAVLDNTENVTRTA